MSPLRVMSFNIRYPEPSDGAHAWENRRPLVADVISGYSPDVAALQEPVLEQLLYLDQRLPGYARFGVSRYGDEYEKFTAVYYRRDTIEVTGASAFWFSETPDVAGSASWGIHKPYAVNWARMFHRTSGLGFVLFNTHFPYKPEQQTARIRSAELLRTRATDAGESVLLAGDFNSLPGGEVHSILTSGFRDAWIEAVERTGPEGTVHGFTGEAAGRRVDWILARGPLQVKSLRTITCQREGLFPSDHFPILAELIPGTFPRTPQR